MLRKIVIVENLRLVCALDLIADFGVKKFANFLINTDNLDFF